MGCLGGPAGRLAHPSGRRRPATRFRCGGVSTLGNGQEQRVDSSRPTPLDVLHVDLESTPASPARAREAVKDTLERWRLAGLVDVVQLVVSELVTNAVRHGQPPVHMELSRSARELCLEVHDGATWAPAGSVRRASAQAESGRGLQIVAALAPDLRVHQVADDGTVVQARFPTGL